MNKSLTEKIIVLGVDGFEPSLAKKFMDQGKMPALKKFVDKGACREDLALLGGMPTVTPPMWTTLATGAYPVTHGITGFFNPHPDPDKMEIMSYALDSRLCRAEQVWNVFAEAGKKTLVWHWPGSSWPPSSSSPNLHVVDGTQPAAVNFGVGIIDWEKMCVASTEFNEVLYKSHDATQAGAGCVITDLEDAVAKDDDALVSGAELTGQLNTQGTETFLLSLDKSENEIAVLGHISIDNINSPIKEANGWINAPKGAKEFTILTSAGFTKRPCLILCNEEGIYDTIAIYKSKKDSEPIVTLAKDVYTGNIVDEINVDGEIKIGNRCMKVLDLDEKGNYVRLWMGICIDTQQDSVFHPRSILKEIQSNIGNVPAVSQITGSNPEFAERVMLPAWDYYSQWQADCLTYFMENNSYEVIMSHLHNVDLIGHQIWHFAGKYREEWGNDEKRYQAMIEYVYEQTDRYLERFLPYLDKNWTVIITSDHGLITEENEAPGLGEGCVVYPVMGELGYTVLKKDEKGKNKREIDWEKTKAIAIRGQHIYINLKGRTSHGIVDPADKYELEAQIISDLYNYRDPVTGKRVVALALRNKDALLLGVGGDRAGDIIFFMEEGFNIIHQDSLSTQKGYFDTSVSPIFVATGKGIKSGYRTSRYIRQVDVAPTLAVLGGVRMPAQCEGAPMYQILENKE